jgi:tetratricopeptide (TPR) repeat protein
LTVSGERSPSGCPTDGELARLLSGEADDALFAHFDECAACREAVAELGRHESEHRLADGEAPAEPIDVPIGTTLGRYVVVSRVGEGAMGVVYAAYDPELDRNVALKLMRSRGGATVLAKEAATLARISDPRVVTAHDAGTFGGLVYVVMELVDGVTLRRWLARDRPNERQVLAALVEAGEGLSAAHRAGVVHRDFKPDNVMIDREGRLHVTDFGLALATDERGTGTLAGTLAYMAPEQLRGERVDARADQFAFAVTTFEALFGERPFEGTTREALLAAITGSDVRVPKGRHAPARVVAALRRALDPRAERRFPSMKELLAELRPRTRDLRPIVLALLALLVLGGLVVQRATIHPPACGGAHERLAGVWDAQRRAALEASFASHAGGAYAGESLRSTTTALDAYATKWEASWVNACEATEVRREASSVTLDSRMACLEDRRVALRALVDGLAEGKPTALEHAVAATAALPDVDECLDPRRRIEANDPAAAAARADLLNAQAKVELGDVRAAIPVFEDGVARARQRGDDPTLARALLALGNARSLSSELPAARAALDEAAVVAERIDDALLLADAYLGLVHVVGNQLALAADGERYAEHAGAVVTRLGSPFALEARRQLAVAELRRRSARWDDAHASAESALAAYRAHGRLGTLDAAAAWLAMAIASHSKGANELARTEVGEAVALRERFLGPQHPDVGRVRANLAAIESSLGHLDTARSEGLRALAIFAGPNGDAVSADVALAHTNLGIIEHLRGDAAGARDHFARAVDVDRTLLGDHPSTAIALANLGDAERDANSIAGARAAYAEGLARLDRCASPDVRVRAALLIGLGWVAVTRAEALARLDEADRILAAKDADPALRQDAAAARAAAAKLR